MRKTESQKLDQQRAIANLRGQQSFKALIDFARDGLLEEKQEAWVKAVENREVTPIALASVEYRAVKMVIDTLEAMPLASAKAIEEYDKMEEDDNVV